MRRFVLLGAVLTFLAVLLTPTVRAYWEQRSEISRLEKQVEQQRQDVAAKKGELEQWDDPVYVERQARERLHWVKPGEKQYSVIDDAQGGVVVEAPAPGVAPIPESQGEQRPWYGEVWQSIRSAGEGAEPTPVEEPSEKPSAPVTTPSSNEHDGPGAGPDDDKIGGTG